MRDAGKRSFFKFVCIMFFCIWVLRNKQLYAILKIISKVTEQINGGGRFGEKYNQLLIKDNNKKQIYQLIEDFPGISRTQIAEQLKLSKTTVSALVDEMMQEMFVIDEGASEATVREESRTALLSITVPIM